MPDFDSVLHPDFLIPMVPERQILEAHSVALRDGRIAAILPREDARLSAASEHIDLPDSVLMPGLINAHCHASMSLFRGYADDLPLMTWLQQYIWPSETHFISPDFIRDGSELAIADLLLGGTTTLVDQYFFPEMTAESRCRPARTLRPLVSASR